MTYRAPVADIRFALEDGVDLYALKRGGAFVDLDEHLAPAILDAAAALADGTLAPLNRVGDRHRLRLEDGAVRTPPGFAQAYKEFAQGGWVGVAADPAYGGQGLPRTLALAAMEMTHGANMSFGLLPLLSFGAIEAISLHGSAEQKARYLPKLIAGEWTGTMNLTEPQAGSDLGALSTKATPDADGAYRISGQKIFITWGEHDCADNIIHLVLARIEGAPAGSKGISLFIVPKMLADGVRNSVACVGLEEKLGIHASPTCVMAFDSAQGWLIGEENKGLAAMFTMMNAARIGVGSQGVAIAEAAYQKARSFAQERRQGGGYIVEHPDVRRMLMTMRARIAVARLLCFAAAHAADAGDHAREGLLTPIAKAWSTDVGVEAASLGVQIHGGMGFIEETGAAQFYRDARIAPIYEGTNGIQAIDLYGRKLLGDRGETMRVLIAEARAHSAPHLGEALDALAEATNFMLTAPRADALAGAYPYLELAGDAIGGAFLARAAAKGGEPWRALAKFYGETVLARAPGRLSAVRVGQEALGAI